MHLSLLLAAVISASFAQCTYHARPDLNALLDSVEPDVAKWATVVLVDEADGKTTFQWFHYRNSAENVDFWPASVIKLYAVVAALEYLNELEMPLDCVLAFEHQEGDRWVLDAARSMREMISEIFRRSSNEDYTLLLRFVGIDRINTQFLVPERGFPHSALMRGYVAERPYVYRLEEPQRIRISDSRGAERIVTHSWTGKSYASDRGASVISRTTGNCTSTRELAECLRRIMFHQQLPEHERYGISQEQVSFLRWGAGGLTGLENRLAGPYAWADAVEKVFPAARFYHKAGWISTYALDLAYVDDPASETRYIVALAARTGKTEVIQRMSLELARWIQQRKKAM